MTDEDVLAEHSGGNEKIKPKSKNGITVSGIYDVSVRFSKCCNPVPGDEIVGFVTRGRGVSIHRTDCINMINLHYTSVAGLKMWRFMNTHSSVPA